MTEETNYDAALAHELSKELLDGWKARGIEPRLAQAVLGSTWARLYHALGGTHEQFVEACHGLSNIYKQVSEMQKND